MCNAGRVAGSVSQARNFEQTDWRVVDTLAAVNPDVVDALTRRFGGDTRLAERGEPFESTDCGIRRANNSCFVLGGHDGRLWFIVCEVGGRAHGLLLAVFELRDEDARPTLLARGNAGDHDDPDGWRVSVEDLVAALRDGRMSIHDPRSKRY